MLKKRLIPLLLLKDGYLVRSENFTTHQIVGNPFQEVRRFNEWSVDELIYLDISDKRDESFAYRMDHGDSFNGTRYALLKQISKTCFMPLSWGGNLRSLDEMVACIEAGADKIVINTIAIEYPEIIVQASAVLGSQAVVVAVDVRREGDHWVVYSQKGRKRTPYDIITWCKTAEQKGAGELLVQDIDNDGSGEGYNEELIRQTAQSVHIPVIAASGVGTWNHYVKGIHAGASAVSAANIWHFKDMADTMAKRSLQRAGVDIRTCAVDTKEP